MNSILVQIPTVKYLNPYLDAPHLPAHHHARQFIERQIRSTWISIPHNGLWLLLGLHYWFIYTLRTKQNGCHFPDDIFKCILLNENAWISVKISLMFVPKGPINTILALFQIMSWRRPGNKPLSEPMVVRWLMHICVTRPQCVKFNALQLY